MGDSEDDAELELDLGFHGESAELDYGEDEAEPAEEKKGSCADEEYQEDAERRTKEAEATPLVHDDRGRNRGGDREPGAVMPRPGTATGRGDGGRPGTATGRGDGKRPGTATGRGDGGRPGTATGRGDGGRPGTATGRGDGGRPGTATGRGDGGRPGTATGRGGGGWVPDPRQTQAPGGRAGPWREDGLREGHPNALATQSGHGLGRPPTLGWHPGGPGPFDPARGFAPAQGPLSGRQLALGGGPPPAHAFGPGQVPHAGPYPPPGGAPFQGHYFGGPAQLAPPPGMPVVLGANGLVAFVMPGGPGGSLAQPSAGAVGRPGPAPMPGMEGGYGPSLHIPNLPSPLYPRRGAPQGGRGGRGGRGAGTPRPTADDASTRARPGDAPRGPAAEGARQSGEMPAAREGGLQSTKRPSNEADPEEDEEARKKRRLEEIQSELKAQREANARLAEEQRRAIEAVEQKKKKAELAAAERKKAVELAASEQEKKAAQLTSDRKAVAAELTVGQGLETTETGAAAGTEGEPGAGDGAPAADTDGKTTLGPSASPTQGKGRAPSARTPDASPGAPARPALSVQEQMAELRRKIATQEAWLREARAKAASTPGVERGGDSSEVPSETAEPAT